MNPTVNELMALLDSNADGVVSQDELYNFLAPRLIGKTEPEKEQYVSVRLAPGYQSDVVLVFTKPIPRLRKLGSHVLIIAL